MNWSELDGYEPEWKDILEALDETATFPHRDEDPRLQLFYARATLNNTGNLVAAAKCFCILAYRGAPLYELEARIKRVEKIIRGADQHPHYYRWATSVHTAMALACHNYSRPDLTLQYFQEVIKDGQLSQHPSAALNIMSAYLYVALAAGPCSERDNLLRKALEEYKTSLGLFEATNSFKFYEVMDSSAVARACYQLLDTGAADMSRVPKHIANCMKHLTTG